VRLWALADSAKLRRAGHGLSQGECGMLALAVVLFYGPSRTEYSTVLYRIVMGTLYRNVGTYCNNVFTYT
jgi:hypothetical protein